MSRDKKPMNASRRKFLECSALLGGVVAAGEAGEFFSPRTVLAAEKTDAAATPYAGHRAESQIFSVCQQCNTNCGIKVKIVDGQVAKIDGNPFSPWTMTPQIPYETPLAEAGAVDGTLCPKGYAGIQTLYDPYRIVKVLKRAGKRGENTWKTIPFEQAIAEVVDGGDLFGEGKVEGLKDLVGVRDPKLHADLAKDAAEVAAKKLPLDEFKAKRAENLKDFIDPNHPDLGLKNNQVCYYWGRQKAGRGDFIQRFFNDGLGTTNTHGHTTVCQGSLYFTCKAMSDQFDEGKFTGGSKFYWQADTGNSEFLLFVGANPYEANYGPPMRAGKITTGVVDRQRKMAVADPRCSKTAGRAWKWLPVKPEGVAALGMAMARWMIENGRFDARYLANANKAAAKEDGEPTWTQTAWLVKVNDKGEPATFLRGSDLGQPVQKRPKKDGSGEWEFDPFVTFDKGQPVLFDPNDDKAPAQGELFFDGEVSFIRASVDGGGGAPATVRAKSVLQVYKEAVNAKSFKEWCELAGVEAADVVEVAREFTSHGKRAVADIHRGVSQHTSGFYNVLVWMLVNVLIGNHDWMGGLTKATTWNLKGDKKGMPFDLGKTKGKIKPWGVSILRHGVDYAKTTLFQGYPAKRIWYPFASDIYQETIPSAGDMYPYQLKWLFLYMGAPVYSLPAGHALVSILSDPKKIPLVIASDITVGETSMYADYVFPDLTYLERWEFSGSHPSQPCKVAPFRQPAAAPMTDTVTVYGRKTPICLESTLLAMAERLKLAGFGDNSLGEGMGVSHYEDYYLRMVANIAFGEKEDGSEKVPAASPQEIEAFKQARKHLPESVFDAARWEKLIGPEMWPRAVTVLNRGGRFQEYAKAYKDGQLANKYGKMVGLFFDNLHKTKDSMTGKPYLQYGNYVPGPADCTGKLIEDEKAGYDLTLITYKTISQTKSRTSGNYWLQAVWPENFVEVAAADASRMGLKDGDLVRVCSASNPEGVWDLGNGKTRPMTGKVKVRQGLRPGVTAFSLGHGHWAQGAGEWTIDGKPVAVDPRRMTGVHANAAMRLDPVLKNTGLTDVVGASAVFYQTKVKLVKA